MNNEMTGSNCLNMQFKLLNGLFYDNKVETDEYIFCNSIVMDDCFWNSVYFKNRIASEMIVNIEKEFKKINRIPCIYISRDDINYLDNKNIILNSGYELNNTDVYMKLENRKTINLDIDIKVVESEKEYIDFMKVLSSAYNDNIENLDENVYADAVTDCYYKAVRNTINSRDHIHIIAYDNDIPVSVATLNYIDGVGGINNVGTAQGHWNKGYGKQLLSYLINKFYEFGGGILTLSTEYKSKNQQFYEKLGFKEAYIMEQYIKK